MRDPEAAIREAEQALAIAPQAPEPRLLLARIYLATGRGERAVEQYRAVLGYDPANREVRNLLIGYLLSRRAFADAGREAEAGLKQYPEDTNMLISLALAQDGEGRRKEAVATLKGAAARDTVSPQPLISLGALLVRHREYIPALQSYEEALKRSPDDMRVINNIAILHADHGYDLKRAGELASRNYTRNPGAPAAADTMGWVLFKQGKLDQALPLLQQAAAKAPQVPETLYHFGVVLLKAGQTVLGRKYLEAALKISRDFDGAATARNLLEVMRTEYKQVKR
jgi:Tfp pilus assembly protein PilF